MLYRLQLVRELKAHLSVDGLILAVKMSNLAKLSTNDFEQHCLLILQSRTFLRPHAAAVPPTPEQAHWHSDF